MNSFLIARVLRKVYKTKHCKVSFSKAQEGSSELGGNSRFNHLTFSNGRECVKHFTYIIFFSGSQRS